jgi:hypothetical protein
VSRRSQPSTPELAFYVPEPRILLMGCGSFVPDHGFGRDADGNLPPFHAPRDLAPSEIGGRSWTPEHCPTCGGQLRHDTRPIATVTHCARCDSSGAHAEKAIAQQRAALHAADSAVAAAGQCREKLARKAKQAVLTEVERRRIWNGYTSQVHAEEPEPTNRAAVGRAFLREIGQLPDFSRRLDEKGNFMTDRYAKKGDVLNSPWEPLS